MEKRQLFLQRQPSFFCAQLFCFSFFFVNSFKFLTLSCFVLGNCLLTQLLGLRQNTYNWAFVLKQSNFNNIAVISLLLTDLIQLSEHFEGCSIEFMLKFCPPAQPLCLCTQLMHERRAKLKK